MSPPVPQYLYHYTSIEALSQILATRQLRLSRLDKVDDLSEGETEDFGWSGHYIFVSCWTDLVEESLPFWSMYTTPRSAVRIKLPFLMLADYHVERHDPQTNGHIVLPGSPMPEERIFGADYTVLPYRRDTWHKITYTDDKELLKPKVLTHGSAPGIAIGKLGLYKSLAWQFQSEYRYMAIVFPFSIGDLKSTDDIERLVKEASHAVWTKKPLGMECISVDLDKSALAGIEVTLGPRCTEGAETIVRALLEKYAPTGRLKRSVLTGKIALKNA